jgi:hypothetical protein
MTDPGCFLKVRKKTTLCSSASLNTRFRIFSLSVVVGLFSNKTKNLKPPFKFPASRTFPSPFDLWLAPFFFDLKVITGASQSFNSFLSVVRCP